MLCLVLKMQTLGESRSDFRRRLGPAASGQEALIRNTIQPNHRKPVRNSPLTNQSLRMHTSPAPSPAPAHPSVLIPVCFCVVAAEDHRVARLFPRISVGHACPPSCFLSVELEIKNKNKKRSLLSSGGFPHHDLTGPPPLLFTGIPHRSSVSLASFWHLLAPLQSADCIK